MKRNLIMAEQINVSKNIFVFNCALIVILAIALIITLFKLGEKEPPIIVDRAETAMKQDKKIVPIDKKLQQFLIDEDVFALMLMSANGEFRLTGIYGETIPICGELVKGKIVDHNCGFKDEKLILETQFEFKVLGAKFNPKCKLAVHQGKLAWIHAKPNKAKHTYPCHKI